VGKSIFMVNFLLIGFSLLQSFTSQTKLQMSQHLKIGMLVNHLTLVEHTHGAQHPCNQRKQLELFWFFCTLDMLFVHGIEGDIQCDDYSLVS